MRLARTGPELAVDRGGTEAQRGTGPCSVSLCLRGAIIQAKAWFTARSAERDSLPSRNRIRVGQVTPAEGNFRRAVHFKPSSTIEPSLTRRSRNQKRCILEHC